VAAKVLTVEHVPPEALGGLPMLLTRTSPGVPSRTSEAEHEHSYRPQLTLLDGTHDLIAGWKLRQSSTSVRASCR
jgi:hypothetical protein